MHDQTTNIEKYLEEHERSSPTKKKVPDDTVRRDERTLCVFGNKVKELGFRSYGGVFFFFFFLSSLMRRFILYTRKQG